MPGRRKEDFTMQARVALAEHIAARLIKCRKAIAAARLVGGLLPKA